MNFSRLDKKIRGRDLSDFVLFQIALFVFCINPIVQFAHLIIRPSVQCQANAYTYGPVFEISPISNRFVHKVLNSFHHRFSPFNVSPLTSIKEAVFFAPKRKSPCFRISPSPGRPNSSCVQPVYRQISVFRRPECPTQQPYNNGYNRHCNCCHDHLPNRNRIIPNFLKNRFVHITFSFSWAFAP